MCLHKDMRGHTRIRHAWAHTNGAMQSDTAGQKTLIVYILSPAKGLRKIDCHPGVLCINRRYCVEGRIFYCNVVRKT